MAELPSGRLSHSRRLHDPPGSPEPGRNWAARRGRRPRGWCAAEWGGGAGCKDITAARILGGGKREGVRTRLASVTRPARAEGARREQANPELDPDAR